MYVPIRNTPHGETDKTRDKESETAPEMAENEREKAIERETEDRIVLDVNLLSPKVNAVTIAAVITSYSFSLLGSAFPQVSSLFIRFLYFAIFFALAVAGARC